MSGRTLVARRIGRVEYEDGLALQRAFVAARKQGHGHDTLLLLEHPPLFTLGRGAKKANILVPADALVAQGFELFETDRGGDVTYHGPGQIVGYPIVSLAPDRCDVRRYVRDIEETMIRAVGEFGIEAHRIPGWTGIWLGSRETLDARKIGAIGVHISRWVTSHGFALNVEPDLSHFDAIVPCGIREARVSSMARELGSSPHLGDVEAALARNLAAQLGAELAFRGVDEFSISVVVLRAGRQGPEVLLLKRRPERGGFWQPVTGRRLPGEDAASAAKRELSEETGLTGPVQPLGYVHAFALRNETTGDEPCLFEEEAFSLELSSDAAIRLDGVEHSEARWAHWQQALAEVPWAGLRRAIRLAVRRMEERAVAHPTPSTSANVSAGSASI